MTPNPLVAAAVIVDASRVLLIRRTSPAGSLSWTFPSGKVEPGETAAEAAAREAHEEAGVTVEPLVVLGARMHPVSGWRVVYVACQLLGGEAHAASPREVVEVAWVRLGEIAALVPGGLYAPVRAYLEASTPRS